MRRCRPAPTTTSKSHSTCRRWPPRSSATSRCSKPRRRDPQSRDGVSESVLLTDTDDPIARRRGRDARRVARRARPADGAGRSDRGAAGRARRRSSTTEIPTRCATSSSARTRAAFRWSWRAPTTRRAAAPSSCAPTSGSAVPRTPTRSRRASAPRSRAACRRVAALADRVERVEYEQMLLRLAHRPADAAGDDRAVARADQGARRAGRAVLQLRPLLEDRGDLRLGEARRGARDDGRAPCASSSTTRALSTSRVMVSFTNDDDFMFFHVPAPGVAAATEARDHRDGGAAPAARRRARSRRQHGEEIAALFDIYVGRAHVYYNPKIRLERLIYRGIREAANAAKSDRGARARAGASPTCGRASATRRLHRLPPDRRHATRARSSATRRSRAA